MKTIVTNKLANHNYFILDTYNAGISLLGNEIKALRVNHANLNDSFVKVINGEAFLFNAHITPYEKTNDKEVDAKRTRKLLLNKSEINKLAEKSRDGGTTIIPLNMFFDRNLVKVTIALAKGKKLYDKRESIKQRDSLREAKKYEE